MQITLMVLYIFGVEDNGSNMDISGKISVTQNVSEDFKLGKYNLYEVKVRPLDGEEENYYHLAYPIIIEMADSQDGKELPSQESESKESETEGKDKVTISSYSITLVIIAARRKKMKKTNRK